MAPYIKEKPEMFRLYYSISDDYINLNQPDSALLYIEKSIEYITDSNYVLNYLLYEKAAEISEVQNNYIVANDYRKKSMEFRNKTISQERNITILELEKKYNHAEAENRVIKEKAKSRLYILMTLLLLLTTFILINYLHQNKKKNQLKVKVIESEKEAESLKRIISDTELERLRVENEKKDLTNDLYNQILKQFFELENGLREIADKSKLSNPDFADKIEELRNTMSKNIIDQFAYKVDKMQFGQVSGVFLSDKLNNSELLMYFLISCNLTNKELSIIFRSTPSSIRSRKHLLKNKMIELGADTSLF